MTHRTKRTSAPAPREIPSVSAQPVPAPGAHPVPPPAIPAPAIPGAWCPPHPPQSMAPSTPYWFAGLQHPTMAGSSSQCPWWAPAGSNGPSTNHEDFNLQAWGLDSHPPGGFVNLLEKNTPSQAQVVSNGTSSQPINIGDDTNGGKQARTEKRLLWTKEEDLKLVSAWLNNSNDPIQANYKKNAQYWKDVTAVFNSSIPQNRARLVKQVKDHFGRIKQRVAWFCGNWKEANDLWASGESDVDLMDRALKSYEVDHKVDGPFMFKHCWDVLRKEPKWDAYLERLEEIEPENRKFNVGEDVGQHFSLDNARDDRPIGGKQAKEQQKRKRKDQACVIDLEDELHKFVDAQNKASEGRKEMLETQRLVSSEALEAKKLAYLAAKEHKESTMLEAYRSMMMQDTTVMAEDVRAEHVLALRCFREKLFGKTD
ncbi:hypothetical protein HU200_017477 [Digitaria exilis]|uniref:No apical meristem-associated C-terminal domain-containing protein n=1 Tax=Digitaria exilis TaxID=1010633 RepID=A0A835KFM1_9POAL|nr:hypothetical protein HU200_017477 [Digitaria exilis]